jgi:hypothetical protein
MKSSGTVQIQQGADACSEDQLLVLLCIRFLARCGGVVTRKH